MITVSGSATVTMSGGALTMGGADTFIFSQEPTSQIVNVGAGNDIYSYNSSEGQAVIKEAGGSDVLTFGPGIAANWT